MWRDAGEERSLFFLDHITHRLCALMPTTVVKPALTRTRSRPVATELEDASSTLLLTLAPPHGPTSHPPSRRKSIEDLRVPPTFHPTGTTSPVKRNTKGKTTLEPGPRLDLRLLGPYGERRKEVEREPEIGVNVMGGGLHPFAGTSTLLRRCVSELDLGDGDDQDEDDESDFASDVSILKVFMGGYGRADPGSVSGRAVPPANSVNPERFLLNSRIGKSLFSPSAPW